MDRKIHLEYTEPINTCYTKNYIEIIFDVPSNSFDKIYLYNAKYGTIEFKNGKKGIHRWENEDEAQSRSYLDKNYPIICLNEITDDAAVASCVIEENYKYINTLHLDEEKMKIIKKALKIIKSENF